MTRPTNLAAGLLSDDPAVAAAAANDLPALIAAAEGAGVVDEVRRKRERERGRAAACGGGGGGSGERSRGGGAPCLCHPRTPMPTHTRMRRVGTPRALTQQRQRDKRARPQLTQKLSPLLFFY